MFWQMDISVCKHHGYQMWLDKAHCFRIFACKSQRVYYSLLQQCFLRDWKIAQSQLFLLVLLCRIAFSGSWLSSNVRAERKEDDCKQQWCELIFPRDHGCWEGLEEVTRADKICIVNSFCWRTLQQVLDYPWIILSLFWIRPDNDKYLYPPRNPQATITSQENKLRECCNKHEQFQLFAKAKNPE